MKINPTARTAAMCAVAALALAACSGGSGSKSSAPLGFPVELEEHKPELKTITKGTEVPTAAEIAENPRAASARLRAVERIKPRRDA